MDFHRPTDLASLELPVANRLVMAVLARLASRPEGVVETGGFAPVEPVPPERLREWLMAKANVLNASTSTFLELIGHGRTYRVPAYQRDYSWTEEQWEELWTDLTGLADRPEETHYMGALVVESQSDREFAIIDGQQRIATLGLLALAVIGHLQVLADADTEPAGNRERAAALRARFIGEKDPASLVEASKLALNATDNAFYQDYLVQLRSPLNPRGLPKSNRLL